MNQRAALPVSLPKLAVASGVSDGRNPGVKEVGAKREDEPGVLKVEVRHQVFVEHPFYCGAQVSSLKGFVGHVSAAECGDETLDYHSHVRADRVGYRHHSRLIAIILKFLQLEGQPSDCVSPANLLELPRTSLAYTDEWSLNAVWMIQRLQACLASYAMLAAIYGVVDIAFDLLGAALHDSHHQAFARRALAAESRVPV